VTFRPPVVTAVAPPRKVPVDVVVNLLVTTLKGQDSLPVGRLEDFPNPLPKKPYAAVQFDPPNLLTATLGVVPYPFSLTDWTTRPTRFVRDSFTASFPLELVGADAFPSRWTDFPNAPSRKPPQPFEPPNLLGTTLAAPAIPVGVAADFNFVPRRAVQNTSYNLAFPLELIGQDALPTGRLTEFPNTLIRRIVLPFEPPALLQSTLNPGIIFLPPGQTSDFTFVPKRIPQNTGYTSSFQLELIGQDALPVGRLEDFPNTPPRKPPLPFEFPNLLGTTLAVAYPFSLTDWTTRPTKYVRESFTTAFPLELIGQDALPTGRLEDFPNAPPKKPPLPFEPPNLLETTLYAAPVVPFHATEWPLSLRYSPPVTLTTFLGSVNLELVGKDKFFGLAGNPTFDFPNVIRVYAPRADWFVPGLVIEIPPPPTPSASEVLATAAIGTVVSATVAIGSVVNATIPSRGSMIYPIYIGADQNLTYSGASVASTGAYINDGTCTYELTDINGNIITSGTLPYVAASNGNYAGVIPASVTATLTPYAQYFVTIFFAAPEGNDERYFYLSAVYREGT
jgi:hypothetical protein